MEDFIYNFVSVLKNLFYEKRVYIIIKYSYGMEWVFKKYLLNEVYYVRYFKLLSVLGLVEFVLCKNEIF